MTENIVILSIETSGTSCGVALSNDNKIIAEYVVYVPNQHERLLAELINRILKDNNFTIKDLSAVAVSSGPGSFTGLRIGASVSKGLCFNDKPKLISVTTLEALAFNYSSLAKQLNINKILVADNSHKDICYFQFFDSSAKALSDVDMKEYKNINIPQEEKVIVCGSSVNFINADNIIKMQEKILPSYINILALKFYKEGKFTKPEDFEPNYYYDFNPIINKSLEI